MNYLLSTLSRTLYLMLRDVASPYQVQRLILLIIRV